MSRLLLTLSLLSGSCATVPLGFTGPEPDKSGVFVIENGKGEQFLCQDEAAVARWFAYTQEVERQAAQCKAPTEIRWYPR